MNKILFVITNLDVGGAEQHLARVLPRLSKQGFRVAVYTTNYKGKLAQVLEDVGIKVIEPFQVPGLKLTPLFFRKSISLLSSFVSLAFLLLRFRPNITHFFLPEAYLFGGFCSLIFGSRILIMSRRSLNLYQLKHPFLAKVERKLHSRMNAVLGNSKAVIRDLQVEGVIEARIGLLYNGIDLGLLDALPSRAVMRNKIGVGDQAVLMVCVANLIPYKGHADLIRALGSIRAKLPDDWVIAMVGRDTGIGAELRALAESEGVTQHILWLGERSDAIAIYSAAEIGVLCSHEEGFSNSVLEGMAAGVAMVVTDVGGNAEAVLDGVCGMVVPARSPQALGEAILALVKDEDMRQRMAKLGHQRIVDKFSLDACVQQYAGLYQALLADPHCSVQNALDLASNRVSK